VTRWKTIIYLLSTQWSSFKSVSSLTALWTIFREKTEKRALKPGWHWVSGRKGFVHSFGQVFGFDFLISAQHSTTSLPLVQNERLRDGSQRVWTSKNLRTSAVTCPKSPGFISVAGRDRVAMHGITAPHDFTAFFFNPFNQFGRFFSTFSWPIRVIRVSLPASSWGLRISMSSWGHRPTHWGHT